MSLLQGSYIISEKEAYWGAREHFFVLLGVWHLWIGKTLPVGTLISVARVLGVVVVVLRHLTLVIFHGATTLYLLAELH